MQRISYPRTLHLIWSEHITSDDKILPSIEHFNGAEIVATQKMDGECTSFSREYIHARSLEDGALTAKQAWSREWVKNLWGAIRYNIPDDMRIIGENLFATHAIDYYGLPTYFFVYHIMIDDMFLSWDDVLVWCELLGLTHVPVLYEGIWDIDKIKSLYPSTSPYSSVIEGYVIRFRESFHYDDFGSKTAKFVREGHVTGEEWYKGEWVANKMEGKGE